MNFLYRKYTISEIVIEHDVAVDDGLVNAIMNEQEQQVRIDVSPNKTK